MNRQKTILITAPYFPPEGGGLERYALQAAQFLNRDYGWRVAVICANENPGKDSTEKMEGLTVYRLGRDAKFSNAPFGFGWPGKIKRIIADEKPDVINIHTPVPGLGDMASFAGRNIPQVVTYHTGSMRKGNYLDIFILPYEKVALKFMLRRAKAIICSSDFVRTDFLKKYISKSETITPGVDAKFFAPNPKVCTQDPTLLFAASLARGQEHKGLKTLLDATRILKKEFSNIKLIIAGDGDLKNNYESYAAQNDLKASVEFRGKLQRQELLEAYQEANVFTLPTAIDSQPLVILEAMSAGLPTVSTRIGGIPNMIKEGEEGFLIEPHSPQILADKIAELFRDPQMRKKFSGAARERAIKDFSWQKRMEKYNEILEKAIGE